MKTRIQKWGNSLAVRIPKELADSLDFTSGTVVRFAQSGKNIEIERVNESFQKKEYSLNQLLKGMSPEHVHPETGWGIPEGKELW
jgi:antitoxin MazE